MDDVKTKTPASAGSGSGESKTENRSPAQTAGAQRGLATPLTDLRSEIDRLFSEFSGRFPGFTGGNLFDWEPWRGAVGPAGFAAPTVDFTETDSGYEVVAELPGLGSDDVSVELKDNVLTISGEKREESDRKEKELHLSERRFGSFKRSFRLPTGIDEDKVEAQFDKGVLHVVLPKTEDATQQARKIDVKSA